MRAPPVPCASTAPLQVFWDPPVDEAMDVAFQSVGAAQPYLALAFPQHPGYMVPGDAVVVTQDSGAANGVCVWGRAGVHRRVRRPRLGAVAERVQDNLNF